MIQTIAVIFLLLSSPLAASLTLDEKIGQLLVVTAYGESTPPEEVERALQDYHVGAILYNGRWDPALLRHMTLHYQKFSPFPLLHMQDMEWGLQMRHPAALPFPKNMTLGSIQDDTLIYDLARHIAKQAKLVGINVCLAPVVDVNSNPKNPVIGDRSFGEDPLIVAKKAIQYVKGLQDEGILACCKHFPGHGNTDKDSHITLPKISSSKEELAMCELIPFHACFTNGAFMVMTGHLLVGDDPLPASLSPATTCDLLQKELGFTGITITDDLYMKAISDSFTPKEAVKLAFLAGNDLIISSHHVKEAFEGIKELLQEQIVSEEELNRRVDKIMALKRWIGVQPAYFEEALWEKLYTQEALEIKKKIYEQAITCPKKANQEPFFLPQDSTLFIQIGGEGKSPLYTALKQELPQLAFCALHPLASKKEREELLFLMDFYDRSIISYQGMHRTDSIKSFIQESEEFGPIHILFDSPYALSLFGHGFRLLVAYENDPDAHIACANILLGHKQALGRLPVLSHEWDSP